MTKLIKTAVDSNAKEYWNTLWKGIPYASELTKKIVTRKLKAALELEMRARRTASKDTESFRFLNLDVAPLASHASDSGVTIEGVFKGEMASASGDPTRVARLFKASLDLEGNLTEFRSIEAI